MAPFQPASEPSESVDERIFAGTSPISRVSSAEQAQGLSFDWSMVEAEEKEDGLNAEETNPLDSWECFETSLPGADLQLTAMKAVTIEVPHFTFDGDMPKLEGPQKMSARPMLWKLQPEQGWTFLTMEFPGDKDRSKKLVETHRPGFPHQGRTYYYVSSSKGTYPKGPTAWLASPPVGGPEQIDKQLGFGTSLVLAEPSAEIPFPVFRLRARVKQLFSSVIASIDTDSIQITRTNDFRTGKLAVIRDDGAGEADPDILTALAKASTTLKEDFSDVGLCRSVTQSAQIRCAGLKGMLLGSPRLQGTRKVVVPESMKKFGSWTFTGEHLHVLNFSRIRPTTLGRDAVLRLEACGCDANVFVEEQQRYLKKIGNCKMSMEDAFDCLRVAQQAADENDEHSSAQSGGMRFLGTFLRMLQSGFSPQQHPLLEVILRQKEKALERAKAQVHVCGCWSARGHPEPHGEDGEDASLELMGNEVFLMVPSDGEESGWKAVTGKVIVNYLSDRDPFALRLASAKDSPALRAKCAPGVLYFSKLGEPLQTNLSWDFDGDYFQIVTHEKLVNSFKGDTSPLPLPDFETAVQPAVQINSLVDVHAHFLSEYHQKDQIGLFHWKWQKLAGAGPTAASSTIARKAAAAYCKSLDVEKGKSCPKRPVWDASQTWDFMNRGDAKTCSPTATGQCFRQAAAAHKEFVAAAKPASRGLDADLKKAWAELSSKFGSDKCRELEEIASDARGKLIAGIKEQCQKAEGRARSKNPFATSNDDIVAEQWLKDLRAATLQRATEKGVSLHEVALAGWHLKYVSQGVQLREKDPDPSFPWTLFGRELLEHKEQQQLCLSRELRGSHRLLRKLQRRAVQATQDATKQGKLQEDQEAITAMKCRMKCSHCSNALEKLLAKVHLDGTAADIVEAIRGISGAGGKEQVDCQELRFAKRCIPDLIENGPQSGTKLTDLVDRLVKGEELVQDLVLTAVRFHGQLYVVEGNRRLWCLQEAQRRLQKTIMVSVIVPDLYLGFIRRQDHKEPALSYFLERFDSNCEGKNVEVVSAESPKAMSTSDPVSTSQIAPADPHSVEAPTCPKCSGNMLKQVKRQDLSEFWGCANYFKSGCRGTINIPSSISAQDRPLTPAAVATRPAPAVCDEQKINTEPPACPQQSCGQHMVRRTNRSTGQPFWGCSRYPTCTGTRNIGA